MDTGYSGLLGPTARPMVALGGTSAWRQRTIRGITCSFQWLDLSRDIIGPGDRKGEPTNPCMCLYCGERRLNTGAYVIPQQNAFEYGKPDGSGTPKMFACAFALASTLGFDVRDRHAIRQCIDIILEGIPDLVDMPSEPPNSTEVLVKKAVLGIQATARINGHKIHEELL